MDDFRNHEASELKASLETKFAEVPGQLDDLKNSVEPQVREEAGFCVHAGLLLFMHCCCCYRLMISEKAKMNS